MPAPWLSTTDMLGEAVVLPRPPRRIVSLVPSQTELLHDLGLETEVVGITKFCVHPEAWFRTKARVGGTKDVKPERVAALQPDLIIANKEENVREQVEALRDIAPVWTSDIANLDDALRMIDAMGALVNKANGAQDMSARIASGFAQLPAGRAAHKVLYLIWRKPWMGAGSGTFIHDLLGRCGWVNALATQSRYPALSDEALSATGADVVLLSSEPYPFKEQQQAEIKALLPRARVLLVDGELFSWYGSRLLHAPGYFAGLIQQLS